MRYASDPSASHDGAADLVVLASHERRHQQECGAAEQCRCSAKDRVLRHGRPLRIHNAGAPRRGADQDGDSAKGQRAAGRHVGADEGPHTGQPQQCAGERSQAEPEIPRAASSSAIQSGSVATRSDARPEGTDCSAQCSVP